MFITMGLFLLTIHIHLIIYISIDSVAAININILFLSKELSILRFLFLIPLSYLLLSAQPPYNPI